MLTKIDSLPKHKQNELLALKNALIPRFPEIEMIILFGSYATGNYVEEEKEEYDGIIFEYKSDFDLLCITTKNSQADSDSFIFSVMGRLDSLNAATPINPIFHGIDFVNSELRDGNYFFNEIKTQGIVLFTTNRYELDVPQPKSPLEQQAAAQRYFDAWYQSANEFLLGYEFHLQSGHLNTAAFQLHQATERYYGALQLVFTGYKPKSHDIEILGKLAKALDKSFGAVFPFKSADDRRRFVLLKKAYVDARYNIDYRISTADLDFLSTRVRVLRALVLDICTKKIKSFLA